MDHLKKRLIMGWVYGNYSVSGPQPPARSELRAGILEERPSFQRDRGCRYAPDCGRGPGSSPVKAERLGRFRSKECGKPFSGSVSNTLASLLVKLPR